MFPGSATMQVNLAAWRYSPRSGAPHSMAIAATIAAALTASVAFAEEPKPKPPAKSDCNFGEQTSLGCQKVKEYDFKGDTSPAPKGSTGPTKPTKPVSK